MDKRINWEVCLMAYGRITKKQTEILEYIKSQILNKGDPPSVRDICEAVHLKSTSWDLPLKLVLSRHAAFHHLKHDLKHDS